MFQLARPLFLTCETSLHAGSGDSLGIVDLPIQRERHTSFPKIEASSLKGCLRESFEDRFIASNPKRDHSDILSAFGPDESSSENAGALGFTDARLLLFPVKSMKSVFAWITSPKVLRQFSEDLKLSLRLEITGITAIPDGQAAPMGTSNNLEIAGKFVLEEYTFQKANPLELKINNQALPEWLSENLFVPGTFWNTKAKQDILVLSDNGFKDFVNLSTEIITRTKIDNETGTVMKGALFTEEYLPAECVLYSLVLASPEFKSKKNTNGNGVQTNPKTALEIMNFFTSNLSEVIQLGGNTTLGKGLLRTKIIKCLKS